jgi:N-carbamoylputrescine amidase
MTMPETGDRVLRAAMTQTVNAYPEMPQTVEGLEQLAGKTGAIRDANLQHHADLIAQAAAEGAQIIGLGELFTGPYFALEQRSFWREMAESSFDGPSVQFLQDQARRHQMVIVAPIYEQAEDRYFNTAVFIDADGTRLGHYRKTHIPQGGNEQGDFDERFYYRSSTGEPQAGSLSDNPFFPVFQSAVARVGAAICFDRHFEGVMSSLAAGGAELVFSPAVTFGSKSQLLWEKEFQVDATRHQLFIGGSNRKGSEAPWHNPYFGETHFVGPNGACANRSSHPNLVVADLPLSDLTGGDPAGWGLQRNRRKECYSGFK